jgi:uncharacterized protein YqcC (DUF446 family)
MPTDAAIAQKIKEITKALKECGLWQEQEPQWVSVYHDKQVTSDHDFFSWLQFIYLPNLLLEENNRQFIGKKAYVAPQAVHFFPSNMKDEKLLQLLVELDSLTD